MNKIWQCCLNKNWNIKIKRNIFLYTNVLIAIVISLILWFVLKTLITDFNKVSWLICFVGYFAVIDYIAGIIFLYNHEN